MTRTIIAVCTNKNRPSVQSNYGSATAGQYWVKEAHHILSENNKTLCGVNCEDWLPMGELPIDAPGLCDRCAKKHQVRS